jgi:hypothetical protein
MENGFIDHLHLALGAASIYTSVANLHILKITTAPAKPFFQPAVPSSVVP